VEFRDKQLTEFDTFLTVYSEGEIRDCLRETCNKIIHAEDVRITYGDNDEEDEKRVWHMTNTVELQGSFRSKKWSISFQVLAVLEKSTIPYQRLEFPKSWLYVVISSAAKQY